MEESEGLGRGRGRARGRGREGGEQNVQQAPFIRRPAEPGAQVNIKLINSL